MFGLLISCLSVLLVVAAACSGTSSTLNSRWSLQLTTTGGFVGIGNGNLSLSSEGNFKYEPPGRPSEPRKPCEGKLSTEELKPVNEAVMQSSPKQWNQPGLNVAAPDAFGYKLELRTEAQLFSVQWYDNTTEQLPADLKRLSSALMQVKQKAAKKCPA